MAKKKETKTKEQGLRNLAIIISVRLITVENGIDFSELTYTGLQSIVFHPKLLTLRSIINGLTDVKLFLKSESKKHNQVNMFLSECH